MRHVLVGRLTEQIFGACRRENTLTVVRVQLVSALGAAHGVLGFAHVASHVSVRVVLDEQLASLRVCGQSTNTALKWNLIGIIVPEISIYYSLFLDNIFDSIASKKYTFWLELREGEGRGLGRRGLCPHSE